MVMQKKNPKCTNNKWFIHDKINQPTTYLLRSSFGENRKTQQVGEVSKQDGLLYQKKFDPSSFQENATRKFAQHQNHKSELYNPTNRGKNLYFFIYVKKHHADENIN